MGQEGLTALFTIFDIMLYVVHLTTSRGQNDCIDKCKYNYYTITPTEEGS